VHGVFCSTRIGELYNAIAEFPDSATAIHELRQALEVTQQHALLASKVRATLSKRSLHPGATTPQIIEIYISTIKVLRLLDPSDALLDAVATPIRDYLRQRRDTVRCIVTSLTDEDADLYGEQQQASSSSSSGVGGEGGGQGQEEDEDEERLAANAISWKPRLRSSDALLGGNGGHGGGGVRFDLLGMLINIYGSKELFVDEYRAVLSGKLLRNTSFDTSKEVSTLELLKLRFGEAAMHHCEIMVRDVDESKRLNNTVSRANSRQTTVRLSVRGAPSPLLLRLLSKKRASRQSKHSKLKAKSKAKLKPKGDGSMRRLWRRLLAARWMQRWCRSTTGLSS